MLTRMAQRTSASTVQSPASGTAARVPLFFLLHCNVDRLWARWQRQAGRFDPALASSYETNPSNRIGHRLPDTMWPRGTASPGGNVRQRPRAALWLRSPCVAAPGPQRLEYQPRIAAPHARMESRSRTAGTSASAYPPRSAGGRSSSSTHRPVASATRINQVQPSPPLTGHRRHAVLMLRLRVALGSKSPPTRNRAGWVRSAARGDRR